MMTLAEVNAETESSGRPEFLVAEAMGGYVTRWNGNEIYAKNPFLLDSRLDACGAPRPRNLFLVSFEDYEEGARDE